MRRHELFVLGVAATLLGAGCSKHIVSAAPPSVIAPPPEERPVVPAKPAPPLPAATPTPEPAPEPAPAEPTPEPARRPAPRPRPAQAETPDAQPTPPKPAPPQISPQLSAKDLDAARNRTTSQLKTAEENLQAANGKPLNAAQKDLVEKIRGFLDQSHEAIRADDWVRAQNLAEKASVLSVELKKSF
jgi:outer membrane biosynthesis protein TonB